MYAIRSYYALEPLDSSEPGPPFPLVTQPNKGELLARLEGLGVGVANVEFFS